jgi:quercetin dioxygenase-like cupin family protein
MTRKEPGATKQEFDSKVMHIGRGDFVDLESHGTANILCGDRMMLSFVDMPANSYAEPHSHSDIEQVTILLKGDIDFVLNGKVYSVHEGDVLIFGPDEVHGGYVGPNGARVLDVFDPPRGDLLAKMPLKASPRK